jgi:lipid II isoglutaminyl synthase (glutamine-hydrolysing)
MTRARDAIAILGSRAASRLARARGYSGTSLPGLVGERLAPGITRRLAMDLGPITVVSGTNGKTTTARLLASILAAAGHRVVANPSGANLAQAISTALTARADLTGAGLRRAGGYGVFEVDEAALPRVAGQMAIAQLVLTNLFRDQLDRFGETNEVVRLWGLVLAALPSEARVIYCADDPRLADLATLAASGPRRCRSSGSWSGTSAHIAAQGAASPGPSLGSPSAWSARPVSRARPWDSAGPMPRRSRS